jgi:hypothetical protein
VRAYHQIPVHPKDIQGCNYHTLRPFLIPFHVLWLKKRCPNLPTFYEWSYKTWTSVSPIWTKSLSLDFLQKHDQHLRTLLTQLKTYSILLNPSKCVFCVPEMSFLGYKISSRVPSLFLNKSQIFKPVPFPRPSSNSDVSWGF